MSGETARLLLNIQQKDGLDLVEIDNATRQLRRELLALDVHSVEFADNGMVPSGAKSGGLAAVAGALVVLTPLTAAMLRAIVQITQAWLGRSANKSVSVVFGDDRIEITGAPSQEELRLAERFIERHGADGGPS